MGEDRTETGRRYTVAEAARILDTTAEAIRSRIKRGTLQSIKEGSTVYVLLRPDQTPPEQGPASDQSADRTRPGALIDAKDETIAALREQLDQANERDRENRRIIAALTQRIPAIEAPPSQEPSESPTAATEQPGRVGPQTEVESTQEGAEPRSWWQRIFGG